MNSLLPVFVDSDILKVFHGCDSDIIWLQRDFGLYIVNCFDTYQAAKLLRYPSLSLAHLLKFHCNILLNKKHQLSDWRQRPLPEEMIAYARDDTHYLLYIYDVLKRAVLKAHGLEGLVAVLDASKRSCMQRFEKEVFQPRGYTRLLQHSGSRKLSKLLSSSQRGAESSSTTPDLTVEQDLALMALWEWRDSTARELDESVGFVMSNAELIRIGMAVPLDELQLLRCRPLGAFPTSHASEIVNAIASRLSGGASVTVSDSKRFGAVDVSDEERNVRFETIGALRSKPPSLEFDSVFKVTPSIAQSSSVAAAASTLYPSTPDARAGARLASGFGASSPVLGTDEVRRRCSTLVLVSVTTLILPACSLCMCDSQIYRLAGWRTPCPFPLDGSDIGMVGGAHGVSESLREPVLLY